MPLHAELLSHAASAAAWLLYAVYESLVPAQCLPARFWYVPATTQSTGGLGVGAAAGDGVGAGVGFGVGAGACVVSGVTGASQ